MNAPAFTPGPWRLDGSSSIYALNLEGTNRFYASVQSGWSTAGRNRTSEAELAANANLIAAAPDGFAAAESLLEVVLAAIRLGHWDVDGSCDPDMAIERTKYFLAKARGETP